MELRTAVKIRGPISDPDRFFDTVQFDLIRRCLHPDSIASIGTTVCRIEVTPSSRP